MKTPNWPIPKWQEKQMTPEALQMAKALSIEGAKAEDKLQIAKDQLETAKHNVEMLKIEIAEKGKAFEKCCQQYRPEIYTAEQD